MDVSMKTNGKVSATVETMREALAFYDEGALILVRTQDATGRKHVGIPVRLVPSADGIYLVIEAE